MILKLISSFFIPDIRMTLFKKCHALSKEINFYFIKEENQNRNNYSFTAHASAQKNFHLKFQIIIQRQIIN